jgi:anti-sigma B factor antagonist
MKIIIEQQGRVTIVKPTGFADAVTASTLAEVLAGQLQAGNSSLVVDLDQLEYMSSAGLRVLLGTLKDARRQGGDLRVTNARGEVLQILEMSGFTNVVQIHSTLAEAVSSYEAPALSDATAGA